MKISSIHARQILDSRGNPTVEADIYLEDGSFGRAAVPSGASTGVHEAIELRDGDDTKYGGKSVHKAVENVNTEIANALRDFDVFDQNGLDQKMIELDGTENKGRLGANAILAASLAAAHAAAKSKNLPLYKYIAEISGKPTDKFLLPLPMMNIVNGGKHGDWAFDFQELMILPKGAKTFSEALQIGTEIFHALAKVLKENGYRATVGDEGGYSPVFKNGNIEAFELVLRAIENAGYKLREDVVLAIDAAASEFFKDGKYNLKSEGKVLSEDEVIEYWAELVEKYPIASIEDVLEQDAWEGWSRFTERMGNKIQIVGDDFFVTNTEFLKKGIEQKAANAILVKVNQIGTLTETINAVKMAQDAGWNAIISHRSGETEDTTIAHLCVGLSTGQIKTGSLSRSERVGKYNELLRIEEQLGENATFASV